MTGSEPASGDTAVARFLSAIYLLELAQRGDVPAVVAMVFDQDVVRLTCCGGALVSVPITSSCDDVFAAVKACASWVCPPLREYPEVIYDDTAVHLWAELCLDLAHGDHVLVNGQGVSSLEEVVWRGSFATVSGQRRGVRRSLDVPLVPGSMETAIAWDLWSALSNN